MQNVYCLQAQALLIIKAAYDKIRCINYFLGVIKAMFEGFTKETGDFLWELTFNNERPWFLEHKEQFERCLKKPMDNLGKEVTALMDEDFPKKNWTLHLSRIYRDARRLFGRGPYKERMWFSIRAYEAGKEGPSLYFELGAARWRYGLSYGYRAADMAAFRKAVDANPAKFENIAKKIEKLNKYFIKGEEYKRVKGDKGQIINKYYNHKWLNIEHSEDFGGEIFEASLPETLAAAFKELMPAYDFILKAYLTDQTER